MTNKPLRLGTRGSKLALWQAEHIAARLTALGCKVEIVEISTVGDRDQSPELTMMLTETPTIGIFTKAIQDRLLAGDVDFAVHSLKDLPTTSVKGLAVAAVPERETPFDAFVSNTFPSLSELPSGACIGTGSLRRQAQLKSLNRAWRCEPIRGNVDTRLRKLDEGEFDAIVLAAAGLTRLGLSARISEQLGGQMLPAPGQGALGLECRTDDTATQNVLMQLDDQVAHACVVAERTMLAGVEGGCLAAVGALATYARGEFRLRGVVLDHDGRRRIDEQLSETMPTVNLELAAEMGRLVAERLIDRGAKDLLRLRD